MKTRKLALLAFAATLTLSACGKKTLESVVERRDVTEYVFASGILEPDDQYNLTAQADGYLSELHLEEGDLVTAGQILGVIDNPQNRINAGSSKQLLEIARSNASADAPALQQVEANIEAAKAKLNQDEVNHDRLNRLLNSNSVSRLEVDNAKLALDNSRANLKALEKQLANLKRNAEQQLIVQRSQSQVSEVLEGYNIVKAYLSGKVYKRLKQTGDFVRRGEVIAVIGSPVKLHALLSVDEDNIAKIRLGQDAVVKLNVDAGKSLNAKISDIKPSFNEMTQSFSVEAAFVDSLGFRISGTQLEANILIGTRKDATVIPRSFLGYGDIVRVQRDSGETRQAVKTGFVSTEWVEILDGLKVGEKIITDAIQ